MLNIYSDRSLLFDRFAQVVMLAPFWDNVDLLNREMSGRRFDRFIQTGKEFFHMTELDQAELVVFPEQWEPIRKDPQRLRKAREFLDHIYAAGKRAVIFDGSDDDDDHNLEPHYLLRTSLNRSRRRNHEFAFPAFCEDLLGEYAGGVCVPRGKKSRPTISFCGYAHPRPSTLSWLAAQVRSRMAVRTTSRELHAREWRKRNLASVRSRALHVLSQCPQVDTNFVLRDAFWGHSPQAALPQSRKEYVENIFSGDYGLCVRGAGNFSYRLYEVLCCGRIPVFIDTDCSLPYDWLLPWKECSVWIDQSELNRAGQIIADFHSKLCDDDFRHLQHRCRQLWEQYLSPQGFFAHFHLHLQQK